MSAFVAGANALAVQQSEAELDLAIERLLRLSLDPKIADADADAATSDQLAGVLPPAAVAEKCIGEGGVEWAEFIVNEMARVSSLDDARVLANATLEEFERRVAGATRAAVAPEVQTAAGQKAVLMRAVRGQHRRLKEGEERERELRRVVARQQEEVKRLEAQNHALTVRLKMAAE